MNKNLTELVFVLDQSGSMAGREEAVVNDYNQMIEKQKKIKGEALVTTILFSNKTTFLHERVNINKIKPIATSDYKIFGGTALIDAIGEGIEKIKTIHKYASKNQVPKRTMFLITTDGLENMSSKYSYDDIDRMIKEQEKVGWIFIFVAENIECALMAKHIGINYNDILFVSDDPRHFKMAKDIGLPDENILLTPDEEKMLFSEKRISRFRKSDY